MAEGYRRIGFLIAMLVCCRGSQATSLRHRSIAKPAPKAVCRICLSNVGGFPDQPMQELSAALKKLPDTPTFKVTWDTVVGSTILTSALRYDRPHHTLHYYCHGWAITHTVRQYVLFGGVTDAILNKISQQMRPTSSSADSALFILLPQSGCKARPLRWPGDP